jgi:hypothetical protein
MVRVVNGVNEGKVAKAPVAEIYRQLERDAPLGTCGPIIAMRPADVTTARQAEVSAGLTLLRSRQHVCLPLS